MDNSDYFEEIIIRRKSTNKIIKISELKVNDKDAKEVKDDIDNLDDIDRWNITKAFKSIKDKETQIKFYKRMNSPDEVLQLVDLDSKPFGETMEKIVKEIFDIGPRTSSQNDGTRLSKKIEIKSARYWNGTDDCKWQHIEPDHDYTFIIFTLLDFNGPKVWIITKKLLMGELRDKKVITYQGKQGWWVKKSSIIKYLIPIKNKSDLDEFIERNNTE